MEAIRQMPLRIVWILLVGIETRLDQLSSERIGGVCWCDSLILVLFSRHLIDRSAGLVRHSRLCRPETSLAGADVSCLVVTDALQRPSTKATCL